MSPRLAPARSRGFTLIELMVAIGIIALLSTIFFPHMWQARSRASYSSCKQNLKNIATGLAAYGNDHSGLYPSALSALTPSYLAELPSCPAAGGIDTYSLGYTTSPTSMSFTVACQGSFHITLPDVLPNQPYYEEGVGLQP